MLLTLTDTRWQSVPHSSCKKRHNDGALVNFTQVTRNCTESNTYKKVHVSNPVIRSVCKVLEQRKNNGGLVQAAVHAACLIRQNMNMKTSCLDSFCICFLAHGLSLHSRGDRICRSLGLLTPTHLKTTPPLLLMMVLMATEVFRCAHNYIFWMASDDICRRICSLG